VVSIVDGDTIDVNIAGAVFRVRYIGIDTPERDDYFFWPATNRNSELVYGQTVTLVRDVSETDQYDRILRYVLVGDTFVNYSLVRDGFAMASTYPPDVACSEAFAQAQQQARAGREGVWEPTNTPPPYVPPPPGGGNCSPAYPTVCIPPPPPDLDCGQISYRRFTVLPPDPHGFDGDHDGIGCESG
jgi:micrococcal nuclease